MWQHTLHMLLVENVKFQKRSFQEYHSLEIHWSSLQIKNIWNRRIRVYESQLYVWPRIRAGRGHALIG